MAVPASLPSIESVMSSSEEHQSINREDPSLSAFEPYPSSQTVFNLAYQSHTLYFNQWPSYQPVTSSYSSSSFAPYHFTSYPPYSNNHSTDCNMAYSPHFPHGESPVSEPKSEDMSQKSKKQETVIKSNQFHARNDQICAHCSTNVTTLWRKSEEGELECNACNLYYRRNRVKRPLKLCSDQILRRKRRPVKKN